MSGKIKHGYAFRNAQTPEYSTWKDMRRRCTDPDRADYKFYGGRGIKVCERWNDFENFLADMGTKPPGTSIERIDHNGNYEPGNCKWLDSSLQNRNKRSNHVIVMDGVSKSMAEWVESLGLSYTTVRARISRGWDPKDALLVPVDPKRSAATKASAPEAAAKRATARSAKPKTIT